MSLEKTKLYLIFKINTKNNEHVIVIGYFRKKNHCENDHVAY